MQFVVVLTGATSGIGLQAARILAQQPYDAVELLLARLCPHANLESIPHCLPHTIRPVFVGRRSIQDLPNDIFNQDNYVKLDLSEVITPQQYLDAFAHLALDHVDLVIHNAALGYYGDWFTQSLQHFNEIFNVNLVAPIVMTKALIPLLRASPFAIPRVTFVSSVISSLPTPEYAVYSATKAGIDAFARALSYELADIGIFVQIVFPGATRSGFHEKIGIEDMDTSKFEDPRVVAWKLLEAALGSEMYEVSLSWKDWVLKQVSNSMILAPIIRALIAQKQRKKNNFVKSSSRSTKNILVTGGARGIGSAICKRFSKEGHRLTILDVIDPEWNFDEKTDTFYNVDLSSQQAIKNFTLQHEKDEILYDVVIFNVGINRSTRFIDQDWNSIEKILDINARCMYTLQLFLKEQNLLQPGCEFVYVSSLSHFCSYPGAAVYASTKDFVASIGYSLSAAGISYPAVSMSVFPGPTRTQQAWENAVDNSEKRVNKRMLPETLADFVYNGLKAETVQLIPGTGNWVTSRIAKLFPSVVGGVMKMAIFDKLEHKSE